MVSIQPKISQNKLKQEKALVSQSATSAVKPRPAVPFGWCQETAIGAVLVKMTQLMRWLSGLDGVLGGALGLAAYLLVRGKRKDEGIKST